MGKKEYYQSLSHKFLNSEAFQKLSRHAQRALLNLHYCYRGHSHIVECPRAKLIYKMSPRDFTAGVKELELKSLVETKRFAKLSKRANRYHLLFIKEITAKN